MNPAEIGIAVADAVVDTLNAGVDADAFAAYWSAGFTARRIWDTTVLLEGNTTLRVDVLQSVPVEIVRDTQTTWEARVPVDIAVRKQCDETDVAASDALAKLTGKIWDYMASQNGKPRALVDYDAADLEFPDSEQKESPVVILVDTLHTHNQFTGIIRLDYRVVE
jgi:hypothetical protein